MLASLIAGERLPQVAAPERPSASADRERGVRADGAGGAAECAGPKGRSAITTAITRCSTTTRCSTSGRSRIASDAIYPATVVGKPRQEDFFIGDLLQELLSPLFPLVMPAVEQLWSYGETGYHSLAGAVVKQRYKREAMASAFRILGEGQLSLTKFLLLTDRLVDLKDFRATLEHVLARTNPQTDLYVFSNLSMDTLDYTGPVVNEGSKGVWLGPRRSDPRAAARRSRRRCRRRRT